MTIRSTEAEAEQARRDILERNRTSLQRVAGDTSFWTGSPESIAATMIDYVRKGFETFIVDLPAPYDEETMDSLARVVRPIVDSAVAV